MSIDRTEDAIRRAERAKEILEHPLVVEAFADLDAYYTRAFRNSDPVASETREDAYRMLRAMDAFKAVFEAHLENGKLAEARLADEERWRAVGTVNSPAR